MKIQKVINVGPYDGQYYNFFNTPGSIDSLSSFINKGWTLVFIKDNPQAERAIAVFEKEETKTKEVNHE